MSDKDKQEESDDITKCKCRPLGGGRRVRLSDGLRSTDISGRYKTYPMYQSEGKWDPLLGPSNPYYSLTDKSSTDADIDKDVQNLPSLDKLMADLETFINTNGYAEK